MYWAVMYEGKRYGVYLREWDAIHACMTSRRQDGIMYYVERVG